MTEDKTTRILKNAILLEKKGQVFYKKVAQQTSRNGVRRFFEMLADEEEKHIQTLSEQFKNYQTQKKFDPHLFGDDHPSDTLLYYGLCPIDSLSLRLARLPSQRCFSHWRTSFF